jgi:hypothetical protein
LRDAINHKNQESSTCMQFYHEQKRRQQACAAVEKASNCDGAKTESLNVELFSSLLHYCDPEDNYVKDEHMEQKCMRSACLEHVPIPDVVRFKHIPNVMKSSLLTETCFNTDFCESVLLNDSFTSVECEDEFDALTMENYEKEQIGLPSVDFFTDDEDAERLLSTNSDHSFDQEDIQQPSSNYDTPDVMKAAPSIFSEQYDGTSFNKVFLENPCYHLVANFAACGLWSIALEKHENTTALVSSQQYFDKTHNNQTANFNESFRRYSPSIQEPQMSNVTNDKLEATMRVTSPINLLPFAQMIFEKVDTTNHNQGNMEYQEAFFLGTADFCRE